MLLSKLTRAAYKYTLITMSDENNEVKLRPFLGMVPGKYLTILYSVILLLLIFAVLFLPGIIRSGTVYQVESQPSGMAVFVDGEYRGVTPAAVFAEKGTHIVSVRRNFIETAETEVATGGRIFGSLFFPKKEALEFTASIPDTGEYISSAFSEFASWGMIDSFTDNYRPEPVLSNLFRDLYQTGYSDEDGLALLLRKAMGFVHNEYMYDDFSDAVIWYERMRGYSDADSLAEMESYTFFREAPFFSELGKEYSNILFWYYGIFPDRAVSDGDNNWYAAAQDEYGTFIRDFSNDYPAAVSSFNIDGGRFIRLSGGEFLMGADGKNFPFPAVTADFFILDREVTAGMFRAFISMNPDWAPANKAGLIEQGLADDGYLRNLESLEDEQPVTCVSWYAADAFCRWMQAGLPEALDGWQVRLPSETEWEWAAMGDSVGRAVNKETGSPAPLSVTGRYSNVNGIYDLSGNVWEWCSNWFAPVSSMITSRNPVLNDQDTHPFGGAERAVRGGSYANESGVTISTRGSQPPSWCSEFTGFRTVMVKD